MIFTKVGRTFVKIIDDEADDTFSAKQWEGVL